MKSRMAISSALALVAAAALGASADAPPKPDLKASLVLARQYDQFAHPAAEGAWEKGDLLPTAKKEDADAWTVDGGAITIDKDGMKVEAAPGSGCYVTLAKKTFKGPIGIRYEAMTPQGATPCDLSVRFGPADSPTPIALAFGGYANTQDIFTLGKVRTVVEDAPLIQPGHWHTVECLLAPDVVIGKIDGKTIGQEKMPTPLAADTEHDLALYVWATTGIFRNVQIMQYIPPKPDPRPWEQVMGKTTKEDLKALAEKMGPLLADDDYATRQAADDILFLLRPLSDDTVRQQLKNTDAEARIRAEHLAAKMGLIKPETPKADGTPPAAQEDLPGGNNNLRK